MQFDLGQKIREMRRRDGRTQEALAEAIGVTYRQFHAGRPTEAIPTWK